MPVWPSGSASAHENAALHQHIAAQEAVIASLNGYIEAVRAQRLLAADRPGPELKRTIVPARSMTVMTLAGKARPLAVRIARKTARWAAASPLIKKAALPILLRHPVLERKARALLARPAFTPAARHRKPKPTRPPNPRRLAAVVRDRIPGSPGPIVGDRTQFRGDAQARPRADTLSRRFSMRIVLDLQACQSPSRLRGIGRYSLELAKAMARAPRGHEIVIAMNGALSDTVEPISAPPSTGWFPGRTWWSGRSRPTSAS